MVSATSAVLLSKAIEMLIMDLTLRAWMQADKGKCRTLKRYDFARAIRDEELFDFLSDIVPLQTYKVGLYASIPLLYPTIDILNHVFDSRHEFWNVCYSCLEV